MGKKTIIVGGGAIGLSVAYHLGKLGVRDVVLLERNQLTSGTSWHAAGIVGPLRGSQNLTELARYGVELFDTLEQDTGQSTGYKQTGGLWLARNPERLVELARIAAMGEMNNLHAQMLSPVETRGKFGLIKVDDLAGSLWVEEDGQVNPVDLCMAYARGARSFGVEIREHCGVKEIGVRNHRVDAVALENGESIEVKSIINCAGLWAREVGAMAGVAVPLRAVEHMYIVTEPLAGLPQPCPVIRDLDSGIYIKEDAAKLVLGTFEANARLWDPTSVDKKNSYLEFPEQWDHAEPMLAAGISRIPALETAGIVKFLNGPESFTPDTRQIMGRAPGMANMFVAAGFNSIGVMSSAGVGKVMAQWMHDLCPPMDLWEVDIMRFDESDNESDFLDKRIVESVHNQFQMHWPFKQYRTGRDRKVSPWHSLMAAQGAVFGAPTGWERPLWFAQSEAEKAMHYSHGTQSWWPWAEREAKQMMETGAVIELSPFSKFLVSGNDACNALQKLCSNSIDCAINQIVYSLMLNERGGIEADCTVTRMARDSFMVVTGAATRVKDYHWIADGLGLTSGEDVALEDVTDRFAVVGVMGPRSQGLLEKIVMDECLSLASNYSTSQLISIGGVSIRANRISYVGELGWELFIPWDNAVEVLQEIIDHMGEFEMGFAGHFCLDSCRLEKGYVHWGHDIGPDDSPSSAGLGFAAKPRGEFDFVGKQALLEQLDQPAQTRRVLFEVECGGCFLSHDEPIYHNGKRVGRTTSGGLGFRTGKALSMGYIENAKNSLTGEFEIKVAGKLYHAMLLTRAPYDPEGIKLKGQSTSLGDKI